MLIQNSDNGTIYKLFLSSGFLNIKQAFELDKICFEFGKFHAPDKKTLKETICFYLSIEDAAYLAEICSTGKIISLCAKAKAENQYGAGYQDMAGVKTSKQMKLQQGDSPSKFFFKALEGPGEKMSNGLMKPKYNESTAEKKISIAMSGRQIMTMGIAIKRAINIFDMNLAMGSEHLEAFIQSMRFRPNPSVENTSHNPSAAKLEDIF